jgi:hypothetical protein
MFVRRGPHACFTFSHAVSEKPNTTIGTVESFETYNM